MKKALSALLVLTMAGCLSLSSFALEETVTSVTDPDNKSDETVHVIIGGKENLDTVYSVTVNWDSLDFTYNFTADATWDPATHTYTGGSTGSWANGGTASVKVTNHSNDGVKVAATIDTATKNGVTASLQNPNFDLTTGEGLTPETADSDTITVSVSGTPTTDTDFDIGTVTVAITANPQP